MCKIEKAAIPEEANQKIHFIEVSINSMKILCYTTGSIFQYPQLHHVHMPTQEVIVSLQVFPLQQLIFGEHTGGGAVNKVLTVDMSVLHRGQSDISSTNFLPSSSSSNSCSLSRYLFLAGSIKVCSKLCPGTYRSYIHFVNCNNLIILSS